VSPSPSPGYKEYTRGDYANLPANDDDLENPYTVQDYTYIATVDTNRVEQDATAEYTIHQFKDYIGSAPSIYLDMKGIQVTLDPAVSTVYLQIYNRVTPAWETVATMPGVYGSSYTVYGSDAVLYGAVGANTDFDFYVQIPNTANYKDASDVVSCRIYQLVT